MKSPQSYGRVVGKHMAKLIPATPLPGSSPELIRIANLLKQLPDHFLIIQRLPALHDPDNPGPDFLLIKKTQLLFLSISRATSQDVQRMQQPDLFGVEIEPVGVFEERSLAFFFANMEDDYTVPSAILFPNLSAKQIQSVKKMSSQFEWVGKELLSPVKFTTWVEDHLSQSLDVDQIDELRAYFTPEVLVPPSFTVRKPLERHTEAGLASYLLDYDQEFALKLDLNLSDVGQETANDFQLRLINGVAGSGKSLIVLYRAFVLRRLFPQKKILILTHNRALTYDLRRRYARLSSGDTGVSVHRFMGWCYHHWPKDKWQKIIRYRDRLELVTQIWHTQLRDTAVSEHMLLDEIDWYKDRLLFCLDDYLAADRTGQGFALGESMRRRMYQAMERYHQELRRRHLMDWGDVPRQLWRFWHDHEVALPRYDIILVDEAQFFAPIWFEFIKLILTPEYGHLFLVADTSQGFLKRGQSWLSSGLEVRGRVHRLTKSYRTTREILDFATLLYRTRFPDDKEDIVIPDVYNMPHGVLPVVIPLTSEQDEITRVINEIRELQQHGVPWQDILVIHAKREGVLSIITRLNNVFGSHIAVDPSQQNPKNQIRVCSLNAATGLESPIVFLLGIHALYEMENSVRMSEEERMELVRDNTRKLYMAITRAGQRLVITYVGQLPELLKQQMR